MRHLIFLAVSLSLFFPGCKSSKSAANSNPAKQIECEEMLLLADSPESIRADHYSIDSLSIQNNCLEIYVNYGGGCGDANFKLYYTQTVAQSMPPQTSIFLGFEDEDPCRSIIRKRLSYHLEPFKKTSAAGGIYLMLGDERILYESSE